MQKNTAKLTELQKHKSVASICLAVNRCCTHSSMNYCRCCAKFALIKFVTLIYIHKQTYIYIYFCIKASYLAKLALTNGDRQYALSIVSRRQVTSAAHLVAKTKQYIHLQ